MEFIGEVMLKILESAIPKIRNVMTVRSRQV